MHVRKKLIIISSCVFGHRSELMKKFLQVCNVRMQAGEFASCIFLFVFLMVQVIFVSGYSN